MRVGVHLQALRPGSIGGVESYVRNLLDGMLRVDPDLQLVLFCADYNIETFEGGPHVERQLLTASEFHRLESGELIRRRLDLWFCPLLVLEPDDPGLPCVATMHDVQHERYPENFEARILEWRRRTYPLTVAKADRILTVSEFSRGEILKLLGAVPEHVIATPLDAGPGFERVTDADAIEALRRRHRLPDRFFYYPANPWPHKNHVALFEALARMKRGRDDVPGLVLTGSGVERADWGDVLRRLGVEDQVRAVGMVPEEDLPALYSSATALVLPSRYEGFGIPLVEAMRTGCPVACSRIGSLPEVAGDAAIYFDPEEPADIARALTRLLDEPGLARSLVRAGTDRAQLYSWDATARRTVEVFRQVLEERGRPIDVGGSDPLPRISVVTPSYQQGAFIERTLRSVLDQGYPNLQYVVIDGGSTDETTTILERYRQAHPETLGYVSESDAGQADAVNKGLGRADGAIIGWLNSDDTYEPGALFRVAEAFLRHPEREFVYGRAYYIDGDDSRIGAYPTRTEFEWNELAHECFLCQPTVFLRRSVFERGVRLDTRLQMCMDYDLWIRIGRECRPLFLDAYLANSRMYDANKTLSQREQVYDEVFDTVKRHYGYLPLSWAAGRAHYRCDGGHPLVRGRVSLRAAMLAAWYLVSNNPGRPRYLAQVGRYAAGRLAGRLRGPIS